MSPFENTQDLEKSSSNLSFAPFKSLRIIKKYQNRKLYDTHESRYCEFRDLLEWIKAGQTLRILDQKTNKDISGIILAKIWWQAQAQLFKELAEDQIDLSAFWHERIRSAKETFQSLVQEVDQPTAPTTEKLQALPKQSSSAASA